MDEKTMCIIMLIFACILILGYLFYQIKKNGLRATVVSLIVEAEKIYKKGMNKEKLGYVVSIVREVLPTPLRLFITYDTVTAFVQTVFDEVKEALDYNKEDTVNGE